MIDLYIADGGEPLWVTAAWIALKYVVVCFALRLSPFRALLATAGMVIVSTIVLLAWDIVLPTSWELLFLVVAGVLLETGIEAAFLTWAFRVGWSWRFGLLLLANIVGLLVSVVSAESRDIERAVRAEMVPVGTTRIELMQLAPGPPGTVRRTGQGYLSCRDRPSGGVPRSDRRDSEARPVTSVPLCLGVS